MKLSRKAINQRTCLINDLMERCLFYSTRNETTPTGLVNEFLELHSIASTIQQLESGLFVPHRREDNLKEFTSWLSSNGCSNENVEIFCFDDATSNYGLRASKPIPEDELTLSIPKNLMMTSENALTDSSLISVAKEDALLRTMPNVMLAFYLMVEYHRKDSFWRPYIQFCPSTYSTPLYYTADDIGLLKASPALGDAVKLIRNIYRQYAYFSKKMVTKSSSFSKIEHLKDVFCLDLYRWATSTIMTRQNQIPILPPTSESTPESTLYSHLTALIPLWDMCNHSEGKFSSDYDPAEGKLLCYAMKDFAAHEQFTIFYGKRTNAEFLINNGFVPVENPYDFVSIRLGLSQVDPLYELRSALCTRMGLHQTGHFALHHKSIGLDENLLNFVRIFLMDKNTMQKLLESDLPVDKLFNDLPSDLNQNCLNFISIRCQLLLKSYSTPDYPDSLSFCSQQILKLAEYEKNILTSHVFKRPVPAATPSTANE